VQDLSSERTPVPPPVFTESSDDQMSLFR
jgi:hypothetical protein